VRRWWEGARSALISERTADWAGVAGASGGHWKNVITTLFPWGCMDLCAEAINGADYQGFLMYVSLGNVREQQHKPDPYVRLTEPNVHSFRNVRHLFGHEICGSSGVLRRSSSVYRLRPACTRSSFGDVRLSFLSVYDTPHKLTIRIAHVTYPPRVPAPGEVLQTPS
jgi:hypothetical protein